jgi:2-amino-4-hydroxy-6-hydroxymethyldihydropteridine diphosphokinase
MADRVRAHIGLGSNLGDRLANLRQAVVRLGAMPGIEVVAASRIYETAPLGPPQPDYLNAVIEVSTTRSPRQLLDAALEVEAGMGRVRAERWGPRVVDLDVLSFDRRAVREEGLEVPHPRMHERGFVMVPLLELDAEPLLPGGRTVADLRLTDLALGEVRVVAPAVPIS